MRKFLLVSVMLLISLPVLGCAISPEQRQFIKDETSARVTAAIQGKMKEAAGPAIEKAVAAVLKQAAELELTEGEIKGLGESMQNIMDKVVAELIDDKVPAVVEKVVEKVVDTVLPEATDETGGGGGGVTKKGIFGTLISLAQMALGFKLKGGLA
jgi:hypothetical protein